MKEPRAEYHVMFSLMRSILHAFVKVCERRVEICLTRVVFLEAVSYTHLFSYRERIADLAVLVRLFFLGDGLDSTLADFSQGRIRTRCV